MTLWEYLGTRFGRAGTPSAGSDPGTNPGTSSAASGQGTAGTIAAATSTPTQVNLQNLSRQTKKAMTWLVGIGIAGLVLILLLSFNRQNGLYFLAWASIAAFAALVVGGALGVLFGLPTPTNTMVITTTPVPAPGTSTNSGAGTAVQPTVGSPSDPSTGTTVTEQSATTRSTPPEIDDIGYRDSTSLEQIADWLTKIIIGLTLTQYDTWEDKFENLATNLTIALLGRGAPLDPATPVPGGIILALYAVIGFLISYLWMRRFFILEMVTAKREAKDAIARRAKEQLALAATQAQERMQKAELTLEEEKQRSKIALEEEKQRAQLALERALQEEKARAQLALEEATRQAEQTALQIAMDIARTKGLAPVEFEPNAPIVATIDDFRTTLEKARSLLSGDAPGAGQIGTILQTLANPPPDPQDPWRGKFGGSPTADDTSLEASVHTTANPQIFKIELVVRTQTSEKREQLAGKKAIYFLHPTFGENARVSTFGLDGRAPLELYAWGAFTVGVVLESGTKLELDLATLSDAPDLFRIR